MLGDKIKDLMKLKKISSKELSNIIDVTPTHISYILNNKRDPSMELLNKIADALGVSVNDFFSKEESDILLKRSADNDLMRIERARNKMKPKDKEKMMKILEASFEDYFDDED